MSPRDILLALLVVTVWGVNFTVIKLSVAELPPVLVAALRFFFAAVPAVFFVRRPDAPWRLVIAYGLFMGVALYALLNLSIYLGMPASLASLVLQVQAMFTILLGFVVLRERPRPQQLLGVAVAFGGIALIGSVGLEGMGFLPFALIIAAAMAWGVANIVSKKAGNIDMLSFTVWGNLVAPLPLLLLSVALDGPGVVAHALTHPTWQVAAMVAFLAYPNTLFGFAVWSNLLKRYPTASVAPFTLLVPVAGIASGVVFLGETIGPVEIAGGALILLGLGLAVIRRREPAAYAAIRAPGG